MPTFPLGPRRFTALVVVAAVLVLLPFRLTTPMRVRLVTSADFSNVRIASGPPLFGSPVIVASPGATLAEYVDGKFCMCQDRAGADEGEVVELTADVALMFPMNIASYVYQLVAGPGFLSQMRFEVERGHIGWTYVEVSNMLGAEPVVVGRLWWSGIEEDGVKEFGVPLGRVCFEQRGDPAPESPVDTLIGKVLYGYQGWFGCAGDGSDRNAWVHWSRDGAIPSTGNLAVDMWPDVSNYPNALLYDTALNLPDGNPARVFSSYDEGAVDVHFGWMEDHGIDGVFAQRFLVELEAPPNFCFANMVLGNVREAAEEHGRVFAVMYDVSGALGSNEIIKEDWRFLVEVLKVTESPNYLRHNGKPVVGVWGPGFTDRFYTTSYMALDVLNWFKADAPANLQATTVGGVPTHWRTLDGDSRTESVWGEVYRMYDVISPWTVGRYATLEGVDAHKYEHLIPDSAETASLGIGYMPVVWPGFSWHNLIGGPLNKIPRMGGGFLRRQVDNVLDAGAVMLYVAMFDEVDEGTAMFEVAEDAASAPAGVPIVTLDVDGYTMRSDQYLRLGEEIGVKLRQAVESGVR